MRLELIVRWNDSWIERLAAALRYWRRGRGVACWARPGETRREDAVVGGQQRGLGFPEVSGGGVGAAAEGGGGDLVPPVHGARGHRSHPDRAVPGVGFLVAVRVVGQPGGGPVQRGEFVDRVVPLAGRGADSADDGGVAGQSRFVRDLIIHGVVPSTVMAPNRFRKSKPGGSEFVRMSRWMTRHWRGVAFSSACIRSGDVSVLGSWLRNVEIDLRRTWPGSNGHHAIDSHGMIHGRGIRSGRRPPYPLSPVLSRTH